MSTDAYGFGATARASLQLFEIGGRRSGRTQRMLEQVQDGDRIVVVDRREGQRIEQLLRQMGKTKVVINTVPAGQHPMERHGTLPSGRTFFDHSWVYQHFMRAVESAEHDLVHMQKAMSKTWPEAPQMNPDSPSAEFVTAFSRKMR